MERTDFLHIPLHTCRWLLLASLVIICAPCWCLAYPDEPKPILAQPPKSGSGGCLAVAQPMPATGGWKGVYRAADDFVLTEDTEVQEVVWWGCSYDGRHGEDDGLDQVIGFAIAIYENSAESNSPGRCLHRTLVPLDETELQRTKFNCFGGSDVMRFKAALAAPLPAKADATYWLSITAYLSDEPMWVWFEGTNGNSQNAIDHGVNGTWGDQPKNWKPLDLAFELRSKSTEKEQGTSTKKKEGQLETGDAMIKRLIAQLGNEQFTEREAAEKQLTTIGIEAARFLRPHVKHNDPEIRYRVRRILTQWGELEKKAPMKIHTLRAGETISDLANLYGVTSGAIVKANALGTTRPVDGMMVLIPQ